METMARSCKKEWPVSRKSTIKASNKKGTGSRPVAGNGVSLDHASVACPLFVRSTYCIYVHYRRRGMKSPATGILLIPFAVLWPRKLGRKSHESLPRPDRQRRDNLKLTAGAASPGERRSPQFCEFLAAVILNGHRKSNLGFHH
jgi:hypothetical protein